VQPRRGCITGTALRFSATEQRRRARRSVREVEGGLFSPEGLEEVWLSFRRSCKMPQLERLRE
jgi:hypothetical protein